jgi:hypothetical protein
MMGIRMGMKYLPDTFEAWKERREYHLHHDLQYSNYTADLFSQYRKHLGLLRYKILLEVQTQIVPEHVRKLLSFRNISLLYPVLLTYRLSKKVQLDGFVRALILPSKYKEQIDALEEKAS